MDLLENRAGDLGIHTFSHFPADRDGIEEGQRIIHGQLDDFPDAAPGEQDRETFGLEPAALAEPAGHFDQEFLELDPHRVTRRLLIAAFDVLEALLMSGCDGLMQRKDKIPASGKARLKEALERLAKLYSDWGKAPQAAEWKKRLADFEPGAKQ